MPKVLVAGHVDRLFQHVQLEGPAGEQFDGGRCNACGWIGLAQDIPDGLPPHECTGLREKSTDHPRPRRPMRFQTKRAVKSR